MASSKHKAPTPTELIDWLNGEGLLELDWDFPEDGDLLSVGLDESVAAQIVGALEDEYGIEIEPESLMSLNKATPKTLAALIAKELA